tara:strand:- start:20 stop:1054 length:1035 start_codon:yes stop_codon:yes gene_type:complete
MSFKYTAGLNNMGSYQVSGRPWLKTAAFSGVQSKFYEFPNVTDYIKVMNDVNGDTANLDIVFCEPKRAINFASTNEYLETALSTNVDQCTLSAWIKLNEGINDIKGKWFLEILGGNGIRVQTTSSPKFKLFVGTTAVTDTTTTLTSGPWINLTLTVTGLGANLYLNGELLITVAEDAGTGFSGVALGGDGATGYDGIYDESVFFNTALTAAEVSELYNAGATLRLRDHSKFSNLVSHWQFEDNSYKVFNTTPDATDRIYDRISSNNLELEGGSNAMVFVDGRVLENALSHHKITLIDQQEIVLNCKAKQIFLRSTADVDVSICAGLTGIPAARMYELTGPGIDE